MTNGILTRTAQVATVLGAAIYLSGCCTGMLEERFDRALEGDHLYPVAVTRAALSEDQLILEYRAGHLGSSTNGRTRTAVYDLKGGGFGTPRLTNGPARFGPGSVELSLRPVELNDEFFRYNLYCHDSRLCSVCAGPTSDGWHGFYVWAVGCVPPVPPKGERDFWAGIHRSHAWKLHPPGTNEPGALYFVDRVTPYYVQQQRADAPPMMLLIPPVGQNVRNAERLWPPPGSTQAMVDAALPRMVIFEVPSETYPHRLKAAGILMALPVTLAVDILMLPIEIPVVLFLSNRG